MNFLEAYLQLNNLIEDITGKQKYSENGIISYSCESIHNLAKILMSGQIWASNVLENDAQSNNDNVPLDPYVSFSEYWYNQALKNPSKWGYTILFNFNKLAETSNEGTAKWAFKYVAPKNVNIQEICYLRDSDEFIIVTNCGCFLIPPELAEPIIKAFVQKYNVLIDEVKNKEAKLHNQEQEYQNAVSRYDNDLRKWNEIVRKEIEERAKEDPKSYAAQYTKQARYILELEEKQKNERQNVKHTSFEKQLAKTRMADARAKLVELKTQAQKEAEEKLSRKKDVWREKQWRSGRRSFWPPKPDDPDWAHVSKPSDPSWKKPSEESAQELEKKQKRLKNFTPRSSEVVFPEEENWSAIFRTLNNLLASSNPPIKSYRFQGDTYFYNLTDSDLNRVDPNAYDNLINYLNENTAFEEGEVRYWCDKTKKVPKKNFDIITKEELKSELEGFVCPFESKAVCGIILPEQFVEPFATRCAFKLKYAYPKASSDLIEKCTGIKFVANEDITSRDQALKFLQDDKNSGDLLNWLADWCVTNWGTNYELYWKGIDGHNAITDLQLFKTVDPNYNKAITKGGIRSKTKTKEDT